MFVLLLVLGCSTPPVVTSVSPETVVAGDAVKISGDGYSSEVTVTLVGADGAQVALEGLSVPGPVLIEATLPADLEPGTYDVVVDKKGKAATLAGGLVVELRDTEVPCSPEYSANTELSLTRGEIVIHRFFGEDRDDLVLRIDVADVSQIEYELRQDAATRCSAIFVRTRDGRRTVFADDEKIDLKERAYKLARDMGKPVEVTRHDPLPSESESSADGDAGDEEAAPGR